MNKYQKTYTRLCERGISRSREPNQYYERHHILPKSMGGSNKKENIALLTGREHFICHWLLIKFTDGKDRGKMVYAWKCMTFRNKNQVDRYIPTGRVYEIMRKEYAKTKSNDMKGKNKGKKRKPFTEEHRKHLSEARKGKVPWNKGIPRTAEEKTNISNSLVGIGKGIKKKPRSDESKKKQSSKMKGRPSKLKGRKGKSRGPLSEQQKLKQSISMKESHRKRKELRESI